jgi:diadenosine tetraphosphatase ApaH/serine/threonine PP2A family protein phosphatase
MAANVVDWIRQQLAQEQIDFLAELKLVQTIAGFTVVHSTLDMPEKWGYVFDSLEADANFNYQTTSVCFHGHTHVPVLYEKQGRVVRNIFKSVKVTLGCKYFINVGSVGQPRDADPRAAYTIYDMKQKTIELRRLEYDIASTQRKIRDAGLPERLAKRLELGR